MFFSNRGILLLLFTHFIITTLSLYNLSLLTLLIVLSFFKQSFILIFLLIAPWSLFLGILFRFINGFLLTILSWGIHEPLLVQFYKNGSIFGLPGKAAFCRLLPSLFDLFSLLRIHCLLSTPQIGCSSFLAINNSIRDDHPLINSLEDLISLVQTNSRGVAFLLARIELLNLLNGLLRLLLNLF